jgi:hypothetical protein
MFDCCVISSDLSCLFFSLHILSTIATPTCPRGRGRQGVLYLCIISHTFTAVDGCDYLASISSLGCVLFLFDLRTCVYHIYNRGVPRAIFPASGVPSLCSLMTVFAMRSHPSQNANNTSRVVVCEIGVELCSTLTISDKNRGRCAPVGSVGDGEDCGNAQIALLEARMTSDWEGLTC